jgi:mannose-1-phosphate guanylyltransferase
VPAKQILAEPAQRNTSPAIGLAAQILHGLDPESVMGVFPADHVIGNPKSYVRQVKPAIKAAQAGKIVVLGIQPRWAETGYGYIEFPKGVQPGATEAIPVSRFREKPDEKTAAKFVKAGNFYWNAGMFFWKTSVLLDALREYQPKTSALLASLPPFGQRGFAARLKETFPHCESISIDYAVLERAKNVVGIPTAEFGWNDVGSWNAVYELHGRDHHGNATKGPALIENSSGNFVDAQRKFVALLGVHDLVVVDTPDALLVADRKRAQQVGDLVKMLEKSGHHHLL